VLKTVRQLFGEQSIIVVGRGSQLLGGPRAGAARFTIDDVAEDMLRFYDRALEGG
jgi:hypothetical protein